MKIIVRDNNVEQALRIMKKKMQREGLFRQLKQAASFEKPSEKRVRERAEAVRRARKAQRKKLQREGLLPMPKLKPRPPRPGQPRTPFNVDGPQASAPAVAKVS